jgi:hypothetical protein
MKTVYCQVIYMNMHSTKITSLTVQIKSFPKSSPAMSDADAEAAFANLNMGANTTTADEVRGCYYVIIIKYLKMLIGGIVLEHDIKIMSHGFSSIIRNPDEQKNPKNKFSEKKLQNSPTNTDASLAQPVADWANGALGLVKKNFIVGNRESAVELCIKQGRMTDALLIAHQDPGLFAKVRDRYLAQQSDPFLKTMGSVVKSEMFDMVITSDLGNWKETLALIATYSQDAGTYCEGDNHIRENERKL